MAVEVPSRSKRLTKAQAALMQIEAAIRHLQKGERVVAVTLAEAAEGCLPSHPGAGFSALKRLRVQRIQDKSDLAKEAAVLGIKDEKSIIQAVNETQYWLKHNGPNQDPEHVVAEDDAFFMIFRAVSNYQLNGGDETPVIEWFHQYARRRMSEIETARLAAEDAKNQSRS